MCLAVFVTVPQDNAQQLAQKILQERVAACVNILPGVTSLFWWQGKIDTGQEALLMIKTTDKLWQKLEDVVKQNHPYDVPEIIAVNLEKVHQPYQQWLMQSVTAPEKEK